MQYSNPVIRGFNPDPSICEANGKFYLVCSSFCYFPGVPLYESEDLVNWTRIGAVITRPSQVNLEGMNIHTGIYAPTIRFHDGRFYMITTNVGGGGHFYVYTDDIYGEWSEPIWIDLPGIDPDLYFENGRCYMTCNGNDSEGKACVLTVEIDIKTGQKLSEQNVQWYGTGGRHIEAPHLYKIGDFYYILNSEGGTEYGHMVNIARSKSLWGPYTSCPTNPILTNRNLGTYPLQAAGHGDLIQDAYGQWWLVHLAFRQMDKWMPFHVMGRETCLVPVDWEEHWPKIGDGTSSLRYDLPERQSALEKQLIHEERKLEDLIARKDFLYLRHKEDDVIRITKEMISMRGLPYTLSDEENTACFLGIRQEEPEQSFVFSVKSQAEEAGVSVYMDAKHHYDFYIDKNKVLHLRYKIGPAETIKSFDALSVSDHYRLKIQALHSEYAFYVYIDEEFILLDKVDARYLSSEVSGGFTGVLFSMYCVDSIVTCVEFDDLLIDLSIKS